MKETINKIKEIELKLNSSNSSVEKLFLHDELTRYFSVLGKLYYESMSNHAEPEQPESARSAADDVYVRATDCASEAAYPADNKILSKLLLQAKAKNL